MRLGLCLGVLAVATLLGGSLTQARGESCTTQSQMQPGDRDALTVAARQIASTLQAGDVSALQGETVSELQGNFGQVRQSALDLAPQLKGDTLVVDQVYLLDATGLQAGADAQFYCSLNRTQAEVDFSIRGLTAGTYGFAVVLGRGASPWRVSLLLRRDSGRWLLAGFFPGPTEALGHDGVWYWKEARQKTAAHQQMTAWLLYGEARTLLLPAPFVQSTHLERLDGERKAAAPPALSAGLSATTPLVVKGPDGSEYRFTDLGTQVIDGRPLIDVAARVEGTSTDPATIRQESDGAARALVTAYPELRSNFGGVVITLELGSGAQPLVTERPMAEVH